MSIGTAYTAPVLQRIKRDLQNKHAAAASRRAKVARCPLWQENVFPKTKSGFYWYIWWFQLEGCVDSRHTSIQDIPLRSATKLRFIEFVGSKVENIRLVEYWWQHQRIYAIFLVYFYPTIWDSIYWNLIAMDTSGTAVTTPICSRHPVGRCTSWLLSAALPVVAVALLVFIFLGHGTFPSTTKLDRPAPSSAYLPRTALHRLHPQRKQVRQGQ